VIDKVTGKGTVTVREKPENDRLGRKGVVAPPLSRALVASLDRSHGATSPARQSSPGRQVRIARARDADH